MAEFLNPLAKFFYSASNKVLDSGTVGFFEPGTTTKKDIYLEVGLVTAAANPVALSGGGEMPLRFLDGSYQIQIKDKNGVEQDVLSPIGQQSLVPLGTWNAAFIYSIDNTVQGTDGNFYISILNTNLNNSPPNTTYWTQIKFVRVWNTNETYETNSLVQGSDGEMYKGLTASNAGNDPTLDTTRTNWVNIGITDASKSASKIVAFNNFT